MLINTRYHQVRLFLFLLAISSVFISPANAADKGTIKVVTDPGDAKVYINGKRKGNSPAEKGQTFALKLPEGEYQVEAVKATGGPEEYYGQKEIFVAEDSLQTVSINLKKRPSEAFRKKLMEKYANGVPEPEMIEIPRGSFRMGCVRGTDCNSDEKPVHSVNLQAFEMSKYEVTFEQWDVCVAMGGCDHLPEDKGWGRENRPVMNVSWDDIQKYIKWLNRKTGKNYRLPSEAEWEYAARAGSQTKYPWGNEAGSNRANCDGCGSQWDNKETAPVGSFPANAFSLHDMHGNVWEWVQDCLNDSYKGAPTDGSAWTSGDCGRRVRRGGSWYDGTRYLRSAYRYDGIRGYRNYRIGFRLARVL